MNDTCPEIPITLTICIAVVASHITLAVVRDYIVGEERLKIQKPE